MWPFDNMPDNCKFQSFYFLVEKKAPVNHHWQKSAIFGYNCFCEQPDKNDFALRTFDEHAYKDDYWIGKANTSVVVKGVTYYPEISWANDEKYWCLYKNSAIKHEMVNGSFFNFSPSDTLNYCFEHCGKLVGEACQSSDPIQIGNTSSYRKSIMNYSLLFIWNLNMNRLLFVLWNNFNSKKSSPKSLHARCLLLFMVFGTWNACYFICS